MTRQLHITSGDAASAQVKAAAGCDEAALLVHHDVLSVGRLGTLVDPASWLHERLKIWLDDAPAPGTIDFSRGLVEQANELPGAERVTLWLGSALSDQLLLAFTVALCDRVGADPGRLALRQEPIVGIGMLEPEELASLAVAAAEPLGPDELALARRAWAAATASEPDLLLSLLAEPAEASPLPFLSAALVLLLERFPAEASGLGVWDETLLAAAASATTPATEGLQVGGIVRRALVERRFCSDPVGDTHLLQRLRRLGDARLRQPLVALAGNVRDMRACQARITTAGLEVLAGGSSFFELNQGGDPAPLAEWVGGILVSPAQDRLWYRQGETLVRGPGNG